jgi:hypothetical protein
MSQLPSPTTRSSILGWVKNLKKATLSSDSVNDITSGDDEVQSTLSNSNAKPISIHQIHSDLSFQPNSCYSLNTQLELSHSPKSQEFLRPLLQHKARSANNVDRVRLNLETSNSVVSANLRKHRDSFLQSNSLVDENSKYFGVPLQEAIDQACAKISILNNDSNSDQVLQYGKIPIVVAKCGVYLKKKGLTVEGIFRVAGSSKRLKELQLAFNSLPSFGKKLSWDGYTVHDAASILRRYLNALPEPLIPLDLYETFREPLRTRPRIINYMKFKAENPNKSLKDSEIVGDILQTTTSSEPDLEKTLTVNEDEKKKQRKNYRKLTRDIHNSIEEYKVLVDQLPILSKQLLFYILDLLAMVQNHAEKNLMSSRNLAAIFQPSILSHPNHDMDPDEYVLSQVVVEFLIQYAYKLLPNHQEMKKNVSSNKLSQLYATSQGAGVQDVKSDTVSATTSTATTPLESGGAEDIVKKNVDLGVADAKQKLVLTLKPFNRQHSKSVSSNNEDYVLSNFDQLEKPIIDPSLTFDLDGTNGVDGSSEDEMSPKLTPDISSTPNIVVHTTTSSASSVAKARGSSATVSAT